MEIDLPGLQGSLPYEQADHNGDRVHDQKNDSQNQPCQSHPASSLRGIPLNLSPGHHAENNGQNRGCQQKRVKKYADNSQNQ